MFKRFHIHNKTAELPVKPISKFKILREDFCLNCGQCIKTCIYEVHRRSDKDARIMADPEHLRCKNCFRCIQECPTQALYKIINPDWKKMGNSYWTPSIISTLWYESETGEIPVLGAGYRGKFGGDGFDGMWTDMSEIVRPTRDGIHGREYINVSVDIGRKLPFLEFDDNRNLTSTTPPLLEIPLPIIFNPLFLPNEQPAPLALQKSVIEASKELGTLAMVEHRINLDGELLDVRVPASDTNSLAPDTSNPKLLEITATTLSDPEIIPDIRRDRRDGVYPASAGLRLRNIIKLWAKLKKKYPQTLISLRLPFQPKIAEAVKHLVNSDIEVIHLYADSQGRELYTNSPRFIKESIREVHQALVAEEKRDEVTLIVSGGIAMAEHMAKAIICGADLVAIDTSCLVALGCCLCKECNFAQCPQGLNNLPVCRPVPDGTGRSDEHLSTTKQRIVNLMSAWHNQLLEILGAMGLREVRRLRGETGRAMFQEDMEKEFVHNLTV